MATHLLPDDFDAYLRRRLQPAQAEAARLHLDTCVRCWGRWNAHRWDAARGHPLHDELVTFLGTSYRDGHDSSRALATAWDRADPRSAAEIAEFFRTSTDYLYNLVIWEASGHRPAYLTAALPVLAAAGVRTVLDIGSGIGSDAIALTRHGYDVTTCDHDSPSTRFAHRRHNGTIPRIDPEQLGSDHAADALWIIDTLDHLPELHTLLAPLLNRAVIVVTENMHENRAHGRQRFHYRRPFDHTLRMFAGYQLSPTVHRSAMIWARQYLPQ